MAGNPILAEVSEKFGTRMIRMPVGFYGLGQTSDLMRTWKAWYSLSMQAAFHRLAQRQGPSQCLNGHCALTCDCVVEFMSRACKDAAGCCFLRSTKAA